MKLVLASVVSEDGDQIYPRTWNHKLIGLPVVNKADQERQTVTQVQLQTILANASERFMLLLVFIAGTGLRIEEALGLRHNDFTNECRVLSIQRSVWKGKPQLPKTANAIRVIDIPDELAKVLRQHVRQTDACLFASRKGTPLVDRKCCSARNWNQSAVDAVGFTGFPPRN